jgi:1,4-dihydroxy-2-naphthoate octaprenyltransferase
MKTVKAWISAARLKTLPLSLAGVVFGSFAAKKDGFWDSSVFIFALTTTLCFQILSNFANDLGDSQKGTDDNNRLGPVRAVQSGIISKSQMKFAVILMSLLSVLSACFLLMVANKDPLTFMSNQLILAYLIASVLSIAAAIMYTMGSKAYGYRGFGDLFVFIFFGLVSVIGSYGLFSKTIDLELLLPAITIGLLSVAVLNLNNMRDIVNDQKHGKMTVVVKLGAKNAKSYHFYLFAIAAATLAIFISFPKFSPIYWITFLPFIVLGIHIKKVIQVTDPQDYDAELKKVALSTFLIALLFAFTCYFAR